MPAKSLSTAIVGAGAIGLTSAIKFLEAGHEVTIFARDITPNTTSDIAAAYWAPHEYGSDQRKAWTMSSHAEFLRLANDPAAGIDLLDIYELSESAPDLSYDYGVEATLVEPGLFASPWQGIRLHVPRIDVPTYMPWLFQRVQKLGGRINVATIKELHELTGSFDVVVNCSGLGARELSADPMFPIRGQVMRVRKFASLRPAIISAHNEAGVAYIIPRRNDILMGGTFQYYDGNRDVDAAIADGIFQRCVQFYPELKREDILEHRVGLRPGRRQVRLEAERWHDGTLVIHNYGHAAYGHTLSWGCAADAVALAQ